MAGACFYSITTVPQDGAGVRMTFNYTSLYVFACMHLEALPISAKADVS